MRLVTDKSRWWRGALLFLAVLGLLACDATRAAAPGPNGVAEAPPARSEAAARIARTATWSPGQLQTHFAKHGREGAYESPAAFDAGARETIRVGKEFGYVDRTTLARRRGNVVQRPQRACVDDATRVAPAENEHGALR